MMQPPAIDGRGHHSFQPQPPPPSAISAATMDDREEGGRRESVYMARSSLLPGHFSPSPSPHVAATKAHHLCLLPPLPHENREGGSHHLDRVLLQRRPEDQGDARCPIPDGLPVATFAEGIGRSDGRIAEQIVRFPPTDFKAT